MASGKERLNDGQFLLGLDAANLANTAFDEISADQAMIIRWYAEEERTFLTKGQIKAEAKEWGREEALSRARFSAFNLVAGALIGRGAPNIDSYAQWSNDYTSPDNLRTLIAVAPARPWHYPVGRTFYHSESA